jgi:GNAT superfamily N-acetyltransferase
MDERLEERLVDTFVPIVEIEAIIGESVTHKRYTGTQIRRKSCSDYNFAIERSLLHTGCSVPDRFLFVWEETTFFTKLNRYLEKEYLKGNSPVAGVPGEQIEYVGSVGKHAVYDLHLANVYLDELYISYLFLQNPKQTSYAMTTVLSPDYKGLGNGIFDQILTNVEEHARSFGYGRLALHAANETLRDIYLRRGFETDEANKERSILMTKKM